MKLYATYAAIDGWGYLVNVLNEGKVVEEYEAGDAWRDSDQCGTGQVPEKKLNEWALQTAKEMLAGWCIDVGMFDGNDDALLAYVKANVSYDVDLGEERNANM